MSTTVDTALYKLQMLDYFYSRRAESSIGTGDRFVLATAVYGTSSLVTQNADNTYAIAEIPTDFSRSDLLTEFASTPLTLSQTEGVITCRADLTDSTLTDSTQYPFNTLLICDTAGAAVAVVCVPTDTLFKGKYYVTVMELDYTETEA